MTHNAFIKSKQLNEEVIKMNGKSRYEEDLKKTPKYPDGTNRPTWDQLDDLCKWSWSKGQKITGESPQQGQV